MPNPTHRLTAFAAAIRAVFLLAMLFLAVPCAWAQTAPATRPGPATRAIPTGSDLAAIEGKPVVSILIQGNNRTDSNLILAQVRTQEGQPYSQNLIDVDVNSIAALDRFVTIEHDFQRVTDPATGQITGVIVIFKVVERSLIVAVQIAGNRKFSDTQIREGLATRPGAALDELTIQQDRTFILGLYRKQGFAQVSVDVDHDLLEKQGVVRYQIIEGPATHISKVEITGNIALSSGYIRWRLQTKTYLWIFRKGILDEESIQQDIAGIREMYHKKGYIDVRVSSTLEFTEDKSKVVVRFVVIEGLRYKIGKLVLKGNTIFSGSELLGDTTKFGPGSYAERDKLENLQRHIEDVYGHEGYINRNVDLVPAYTDERGVVNINLNITEGSAYTVGRVIVSGNPNIQDRVIRRQIRIYPDQTFDMVLVQKSIDRLRSTRLFGNIKITPHTQGNPPGIADALVEVTEGSTGKFGVGAGVSTNSGLVGQLSLEQQNFDITNFPHSFDEFIKGQSFKGAGQYFQVLLEPGTEFQRYRLTFSEPYLFDTPYSFANDLYYFTRSRESWDETRIGDLVTFGRRFGDIWGLSLAIRAEQVKIGNAQDVLQNGITESRYPIIGPNGGITFYNDTAQEILNEKGTHFLTSIKPAIVRDTTDSQGFPTTGTRMALSIEQYGVLGGDVDITKIVFNFNWYQTVYTDLFDRKTIFTLRNEFGLIPWGNSPTYERFYAGGIGELRGFKFRGISPRSGPLQDPIGGDFSWVTTGELNFPVYEDFLRAVVFVDVGTVERDITIGSIRSDVGAGVRVNLPFFGGLPISVDFAYPLTKQSGDETQLISVSLQSTFK